MKAIPTLNSIPAVNDKRIAIHVTAPAQRSIRSRHPWLYENSITKISHEGDSGDLAVIFDRNKKFLAIGIYDPCSPIRTRILQSNKPATIGYDFFLEKIQAAAKLRSSLLGTDTNGFRPVNGGNDSLPGVVVDCYATTMVVKIYTGAWVPHLPLLVPALLEAMPLERVLLRMNRLAQKRPELLHGLTDGQLLYGPPIEETVVFSENGILFEADPVHGQKTGFFLDQRENRARVEKLAKDKHVLNVFSYTGGFSLYAARGGAKSVTSLDISQPAMDGCTRNFELNRSDATIARCQHTGITNDAFKALVELAATGKKYDMVIIDPPSFAKKESEVSGALRAYSKLAELGLAILRPKGTFVTASCSSQVKADDFFAAIIETAERNNRPLKELERTQHALDHPSTFPESAYLKCLFSEA